MEGLFLEINLFIKCLLLLKLYNFAPLNFYYDKEYFTLYGIFI